MSRLTDLLHLSHIHRWTITPMARPQSVAEHSFRVGVIAVELWRELPFNVTGGHTSSQDLEGSILRWAMVHDAAEAYTGDIPSPLKRLLRDRAKLNTEGIDHIVVPWLSLECEDAPSMVTTLVKLADTIEALSWVSAYGMGARNLYSEDGMTIENELRSRIRNDIQGSVGEIKGLAKSARRILTQLDPSGEWGAE